MQTNKDKAILITTLSAHQNDVSLTNAVKLIDIMVSETRIDNDRAEGNMLIRNQGKIEGLLELKSHIERGLPGSN
jgi:hypothetical protein